MILMGFPVQRLSIQHLQEEDLVLLSCRLIYCNCTIYAAMMQEVNSLAGNVLRLVTFRSLICNVLCVVTSTPCHLRGHECALSGSRLGGCNELCEYQKFLSRSDEENAVGWWK